jgi:hypothetical protein
MAKYKVILKRVETVIMQGAVMVEAGSPEEARRIIQADLAIDAGPYDDFLEPVECESGDMMVSMEENQNVPTQIPRALAS